MDKWFWFWLKGDSWAWNTGSGNLLLLLLHFRLMKRSNLSNNVAGQEGKLAATKENLVWFCRCLIILVLNLCLSILCVSIYFFEIRTMTTKQVLLISELVPYVCVFHRRFLHEPVGFWWHGGRAWQVGFNWSETDKTRLKVAEFPIHIQ